MKKLLLATLLATVAAAHAQNTDPRKLEGINFECNIGSFKFLDCNGRLTFTFEGTVLLSEVKGDVTVNGNVKLEYENKKMQRKTYFGKGTVTVDGSWSGVQVFGKKFKGKFNGTGFVYLTAEFDQNLKTGLYWYDNSPDRKYPWYTTLTSIQLPPDSRLNAKPRARGSN
jgi:hypothetical protein